MRKIDILTRDAFNSNTPFRLSNTEIKVDTFHVRLYLHGNLIAVKHLNTGSIVCSLAGWNTTTTRSRLNAIGANVRTRKGIVYSNDVPLCMDSIFNSSYWFAIN